jgi:hypothetical protein
MIGSLLSLFPIVTKEKPKPGARTGHRDQRGPYFVRMEYFASRQVPVADAPHASAVMLIGARASGSTELLFFAQLLFDVCLARAAARAGFLD